MTDPGDRSTTADNLDQTTGRPDSEAQPAAPKIGEAGSAELLKNNEHDQAEKAQEFPDPTAL
ncbi:hypothetical protein GCM10017783_17200 [Deinococcus piscis]|uniref:Uncharacterized protein n=1 Tax=Deinococcus piscis TaxID=394230 RepID=A0ABQ3K977_9DEIO|nr:hypothetical protein [Deinococcus piscis]GHG05105.1 hypothetical protein GCM10017783_17200 [Deinococcus piscis]